MVLAGVLALQLAGWAAISREEVRVNASPLQSFPRELGQWVVNQEGVVEDRVQEVLQADDLLTRSYQNAATGAWASLFIAYFESQRSGKAPHSPKNCLPGSGWSPSVSDIIEITPDGSDRPMQLNRYLVSKGDASSVVLYWYQSRDRAVASEYLAKIYLVLDSVRFNRSDTALIRVVVPVADGDIDRAQRDAEAFATAMAVALPTMSQFRPL